MNEFAGLSGWSKIFLLFSWFLSCKLKPLGRWAVGSSFQLSISYFGIYIS